MAGAKPEWGFMRLGLFLGAVCVGREIKAPAAEIPTLPKRQFRETNGGCGGGARGHRPLSQSQAGTLDTSQ